MSLKNNHEFKKYVLRKHKENTGEELEIDSIEDVQINFDFNLPELTIKDLGNMYSFALTMEKYEYAKNIHSKIKSMGYEMKIHYNNDKITGSIQIFKKNKKTNDDIIIIPILVTSEGVVIDFNGLD